MAHEIISAKQQEILDFIKSEILQKGYPPAVRDICKAVHLKSTSSVHSHLETLERKGYIRKDPAKPRAIEIIDDNFQMFRREMVSVPVIGTAAGRPFFSQENIENYFPVPAEFLPNTNCFMLKLKEESMVKAGILNGDLVMAAAQDTAEDGDIVVIQLEDSVTVKKFYKENNRFRLQPENDSMAPIYADEITILGKVFGVFRIFP